MIENLFLCVKMLRRVQFDEVQQQQSSGLTWIYGFGLIQDISLLRICTLIVDKETVLPISFTAIFTA